MWNSIFESGITVVLVPKITVVTHHEPSWFYSDRRQLVEKNPYQKKSIMMKIVMR